MIIKVLETGEFEEYTDENVELNEDSVYIFISVYNKTCYLWYGKKSGVRKQFIAASEGRKIKLDTGYSSCNVTHEGAEEEFEKALNEWKTDFTRLSNPAKIITEQRERMGDMIVTTIGESTKKSVGSSKKTLSTPKSKPASPFGITTDDQPQQAESRPNPRKSLAPPVKVAKTTTSKSEPFPNVVDVIERMKSFGEVDDHTRKYVVTEDQIFSIVESNGIINVKKFEDVVNGIFEVKNYHPRFLMEDSKIIAIELWAKNSGSDFNFDG